MNLWSWLNRKKRFTPRFALGAVVVTAAARDALRRARISIADLLRRHVIGDWGDVDELDRKQNQLGLKLGIRLRSAYTIEATEVPGGLAIHITVWVITRPNRTRTTILLPSEIFFEESADEAEK